MESACYGGVTPAMNTSNNTDTQESAHLEKLRLQISTDIETMQQKEASLREYEQRLRLLVDHAEQTQPQQPASQFVVTAGPGSESRENLDAEWEKYNRAHALLEAARRGLCDDRMAVKDREEKLHVREVEVARREAWVKVREQELENQVKAQVLAQQKPAPKAKHSITSAPFIAARNLLLHRKAKAS